MKKIITVFGILVVLGTATAAVGMYFTYNNRYVTLNNQFTAQEKVDEATFDQVWKIIKDQANVTDNYAKNFRENYQTIMNSRNYGGELMKWIQESNPNYTPELHSKLMNTIEGQRTEFTYNQKKLISIHKELLDITTKVPSAWFLSGRTVPPLRIVTSTRTEATFASGKDDDMSLFPTDTSPTVKTEPTKTN